MEKTKVTLATWGGRSQFRYEGSVAEGTLIYGKGSPSPYCVSAKEYAAMLFKFSGQEVSIGTSYTDPPDGSLGKWLTDEYRQYGMTSYVGPILLKEQYAERGSRSDRIRFKFRPAGETAIASPRTLVS